MVFVKVRETYDLHTTRNRMTVIGIHTPKPDIIKRSYPGLLMQCKAYRPVSADVKIACASVLPLDPQGVGLAEGSVAPEDIFNPILYKAMSNKGMSQLEARINGAASTILDIDGDTAGVDVDNTTTQSSEFNIYYGLLSNTHDWKHANPQRGLEMKGLKPLVYEMVYNVGDQANESVGGIPPLAYPDADGTKQTAYRHAIIGKAKEFPFINCTSFSVVNSTKEEDERGLTGYADAGFIKASPHNAEVDVPWMKVFCGCIIVPPSKLHELFYRMVVEWTIEFSKIRPLQEITDWYGLDAIGYTTHYQNYSYSKVKEAITGNDDTILEGDSCMVSANVDVDKVM